MRVLKSLAVALAMLPGAMLPAAANAAEGVPVPSQDWSFAGIFGQIDKASAQRGYQVYKEVCASCHAMSLVSFRNLEGVGLPASTVDALASQYEAVDELPDDQGDPVVRQARASDRFPSPFPNEQAARAANAGAYPPDLSLMNKARPGGADYTYALLTGYQEAPADVQVPDGMYYNAYFPGHLIAMAPPLNEGQVSYADGTEASVEQMARDVTYFMQFAADPHLDARKQTGVKVILFLLVLTILLYFTKRKVWAAIH